MLSYFLVVSLSDYMGSVSLPVSALWWVSKYDYSSVSDFRNSIGDPLEENYVRYLARSLPSYLPFQCRQSLLFYLRTFFHFITENPTFFRFIA